MSKFLKYIAEAITAYEEKRLCDASVFLLSASEELKKKIEMMKKVLPLSHPLQRGLPYISPGSVLKALKKPSKRRRKT